MASSPCIRCGKDRVLFKKWVEKSAGKGSAVTSELYVCPDKDCQKIVDKKFEDMRQKKLDIINKKLESQAAAAALATPKT